MTDEPISRRSVLKATGGVAGAALVGGVGLAAMSGGAAASSLNISSSTVRVKTDHGEVDRVWIEPNISGDFNGFDETVGKVRILIEAAPNDVGKEQVGKFAPVYRATMWLNGTNISGHEVETGPGYHGSFAVANDGGDGGYWFGEDGVTLYDRDGPDYGTLENPESFFDGTSVGQEFDDSDDPTMFENGMYEQAGTVDKFFNPDDGTWDDTTVTLRYTISFHAPSSGSANGYDVPEGDVKPKSPLVMADAADVDDPITEYAATSIPYSVIQDHADGHPAIMVEESTFPVRVYNEPAASEPSGDSNSGASGTDDTSTTGE